MVFLGAGTYGYADPGYADAGQAYSACDAGNIVGFIGSGGKSSVKNNQPSCGKADRSCQASGNR